MLSIREETSHPPAVQRPKPPGPKGSFFFGNLSDFGRNPLAFLECINRDFGDFVSLQFLGRSILFINDTLAIEQVLVSESRHFRKTIGYRTPFMRRLFGQGLLTSEGDFWLRQRRLSQPAFHRDRVAGYARNIGEFTGKMLATWSVGETRNIHEDMLRITTEVVTRSLFNSPVPPEIDEMGEASAVVMKRFTTQWSGFRLLLNLLPTAESRRFKHVMKRLDAYILGLIRERRAGGRDHGDLLSMLLLARDDDGSGMSDQQLCDELKTLMVAGLDTTALTLSWALYLLARNPLIDGRLREETNSLLQNRSASFEDLARLPYTEAVVKETMRLFPPAWVIGREAIHDCEIGGYSIRPGVSVIVSQWIKHRDLRHFSDPLQFKPERWLGNPTLPKLCYFPFGAGPRVCIGSSFAMMESILGLATITARFRLTARPGYRVDPWPSITLQPAGGIHLTIAKP